MRWHILCHKIDSSINPFDEIAIEEAVRLKESGKASEVIVVTIGPEKAQEQIRTAMAIGADRGILVKTDDAIDLGGVEPLAVAKTLKALVEKESPDLVIMGKQSIDDDSNQTGQMLAALLGWAQGTFASKVEVGDGAIEVTREIDGGLETLSVNTPAKQLDIMEPSDLGVDYTPRLQVINVTEPPVRQSGIKVPDVDTLIDKLKNEAKVI